MVVLMTFAGMTAYGNEINLMDNSDVNEIYDFNKAVEITWKLYGFGTVGEDEVQKVKPEKGDEWWKDEQYTILFKENGTLEGHTFSNDFFGEYSIDGNNLVVGDLWVTEIGEAYDGDKYYEALYSPLSHIFEIRNDQLLLYYNEGQNYLLFDNVTTHAVAQTYYYYDSYGTKIPLSLNENKVLVSVPIDCNLVIERIRANVQAFYSGADSHFYCSFMTRADLEKLTSLDFWEEDAKSVIITPCFYRDDDRGEFWREVFSTPYLMIFLKKEGDIDLLTPYLEKYKLKIARDWYSDPRMRFSCSLYVTPESEKSPIECANELHESGDFAASFPDFGWAVSGASDPTAVRSISTATTGPSPDIYDLQGRRLSTTPQKGVYIQNGKKKLVK